MTPKKIKARKIRALDLSLTGPIDDAGFLVDESFLRL